MPEIQRSPGAPRHLAARNRRFSRKARSAPSGGAEPGARRRRWPRRLLIGFATVLTVLVIGVGGVFGYAWWRYGQIPKISIPGLQTRQAGQPFNVLLVGSDSRQFAGDSGSAAAQYGSSSSVGGQRSDVIIIARVVPALTEVRLLSIPRDTFVDIPGKVPNISGLNRINAAFDSGPALLVQTIEGTFHIPISDYVEVNFEGLSNMVDAVGGIYLDFRDKVYDTDSHLGITRTGCHLVLGSQAVALVRSRHLHYYTDGSWHYDGLSDWSRIQRQDAFFRALIPRLKSVMTNPGGLNSLLSAAKSNITIDKNLSAGEIISLANLFRHVPSSSFEAQTMPTTPYTTSGGADVLLPAPGPDATIIDRFLALGTTKTTAMMTPDAGRSGLAQLTAARFVTTSGVTVTTIPGVSAPSGTAVVYNNQPEPWNPVPCHVG